MMMRMVLSVACVALALAGCKSKQEKREEAELLISTPLEFDPTEHHELARWWSNGAQHLRLDETASYALFDVANAYQAPIERGRWSRTSYAALWLEPYTTREPEPRRVSITKLEGRLALIPPGLKPMVALDGPPASLQSSATQPSNE